MVFGGPRGETTQGAEIAIVFSKPMRALGLPPGEPRPPITITPPAKGAFHWLGSSGLRFDAAEELAPATPYRVEIPAGTRALDGSTLAAPYVLEFTTPLPAVSSVTPETGSRDVPLDTSITLSFNMPIARAEVVRAVSIRAGKKGAPVAFTITDGGDATRWVLAPRASLPVDTDVRVRVDGSLRAASGALPAGRDAEIAFHTVEPPRVKDWSCWPHPSDERACNPDETNVTLELSALVKQKALARAIRIDPPVKWNREALDGDGETDQVSISGDFKPGVTYRLRLDPGHGPTRVTDAWGQGLAGDGAKTLRFGDRPGSLSFSVAGTYWPAPGKHEIPIAITNVTQASVIATPLTLQDVLEARGGVARLTPPAAGKRITLPTPTLNEDRLVPVQIEELLGNATPRGPILLETSYRERGAAKDQVSLREVQITDVGISARVGHGAAIVVVTRLDDGKPVAGAPIEAHRVRRGIPPLRLGAASTDASGLARVPIAGALARGDRIVVSVRDQGSFMYHSIDAPRPMAPVGMLYTDRGAYRPGETVRLAGIFRRPGVAALTTPRGESVALKVRGPGAALLETKIPLGDFGTFAADVPLPASARIDDYYVTAQLADGYAQTYFSVAEYRPTEIAVEATTDRPELVRGDTLTCGVKARHLHGGPMAGGGVSVVVTRRKSWFRPPGLEGFTTANDGNTDPPHELTRSKIKLDRAGALALSVPLSMPSQTGAEQVTCEVEATDLNRQALTAEASAMVHPAELYVALESPRDREVAPGDAVKARALAVTPAGERRALPVRIDVARRDGQAEVVLGGCDVTTGPTPRGCSVIVPRATSTGVDLVVRASGSDARGNRISARYDLRVEAPRSPPPPAPTPRQPSPPTPRLRVGAANRHYAAGDTARVDIQSPLNTAATALVTVEREGILWERLVPLPPAGAQVDVPITQAMIPNAVVTARIVSGRSTESDEVELSVDPAPRKLAVTIETAGVKHAPGEAIDVDVTVKDAAGKPARAEVTLFAVDEGSLSLTGYKLPDPFARFLRPRDHLVTHADTRNERLRVLGLRRTSKAPVVRMGATSVSPSRQDFRQTIFFESHLVTDASGRVRRRVKLADGLTTYRFTAVAVAEEDRFGSTETGVTTSLPLTARASLPRIVRAGDRFSASVVVSTHGLPAGEVEITAVTEGLALTADATRKVRLEPDVPAEVLFPVRADRAGPAKLTVVARAGAARDAMTLTREVVAPSVPESAAVDGETARAVAERLGDLSAIRPDYGGLEITLSPTPLGGLGAGIEQLLEYPHGCTEQTVSRLVPLVQLRDLAASLGAKLPPDTPAAIASGVKRLLDNQRSDGGFGLWPESHTSEEWVTVYALWGLSEAKRHGASVPAPALEKARAYLERAVASAGALDESTPPAKLALAAFGADVLAGEGTIDDARLTSLFAARNRLPPFAKALLLHAMATGKRDVARRAELTRELEAVLRLDGPAARAVDGAAAPLSALLDSNSRTSAMILRALLASDPAHAMVTRLALGLLADRRGGRWRTTQETAWALIALDDLRRARPPGASDFDARVFFGDSLLVEAPFHGGQPAPRSFDIPAAQLLSGGASPLTFAVDGTGTLHYQARLRFAKKALPTEPAESGFFVRRTMRPLAGDGERAAGTFSAGELVSVELDVVTPSPRDYVVLDAPLPAGFEPIDANLRGGSAWTRRLERGGTRRELRDAGVVYFIDHLPPGISTYRHIVRATTIGTFLTPPARVEEMYVPETFGRTGAETITIAP